MRILLLTNLFPPDYDGGYELNAWKVANGLRARGHEVEVVTSRWRAEFLTGREEVPWVHRVLDNRPHLPPPTWKMPWVRLPMLYHLVYRESIAWTNVPRVRRFLSGRKFDLAYVFGLHDVGLSCAAVAQEVGIPVLWHFGDHYVADHQSRYTYSLLFYHFGNTILRSVRHRESKIRYRHAAFVSRFLQEYFAERWVKPDHSFVIPRGIEFALGGESERDDPPMFLLASRLTKDKGIHVALEAGRLLAARRPDLNWKMEIAGSGDAEASLRHAAACTELSGRVQFLGRLDRSAVLDRMRRATAFINASVWGEPFANTVIEALAVGTPLIASEAGSIFEVVESEVTALTYEKESAEALASRMEQLLLNPALRVSLAAAGLQRVQERYTMDAILDETERVMKEMLAAR